MALFSGKSGRLRWDNAAVVRVSNWSIDSTVDLLDVTDLGGTARTYTPGLKSATGSMSIFYHDDDDSLKNLLDNLISVDRNPQSGKLELRWSNKSLVFNAFLTNAVIGCVTGEVMKAEVSFTMDGNFESVEL